MKLTEKQALKILNESRSMAPDDVWIEHSIVVANTASTLAKALNLNVRKARTLAYIHDIGKRFGWGSDKNVSHVIAGYEYIIKLGYDEEYANICLTHSYLNNDINCVAGGVPDKNHYKYDFIRDFIKNHQYTEYEKIINLCDLMCSNKLLTMEERLISLIIKYGVFSNTVYHLTEAMKLKKYFDNLLGFNLYDLFNGIL